MKRRGVKRRGGGVGCAVTMKLTEMRDARRGKQNDMKGKISYAEHESMSERASALGGRRSGSERPAVI